MKLTGFHRVDNIDFSEHVIKRMNAITPPSNSLNFSVIDVLKPLPYQSESFQLILDKGIDALLKLIKLILNIHCGDLGTFDCVSLSKDSKDPHRMLTNVRRV